MADTMQFDPQQRHNFDQWLKSDDITPQGLFQSLGLSPGSGKYKTREELAPSFLDGFLNTFGIQTERTKEIKELAQNQQKLMPFAQQLLQTKIADVVHRNAELRKLPSMSDEAPDVMNTLGISPGGGPGLQAAPGGMAMQPGQANGLQPAPMDAAMAGMPLGASSMNAAAGPQIGPPDTAMAQPLSDGGRFMTPDALEFGGVPQAPQAGVPGSPNPMQYGAAFDHQGRPVAMQPAPDLPTQPIRAEPIAAPMPRAPQPAPPAARPLKEWERYGAGTALHAKATGALVLDETGTKLVPASFMAGDNRLLDAPQQAEAANIYAGAQPSGRVKLPGGVLMSALKGKQEGKAQDLSQGVREYMKANDLAETPHNIATAREAIRGEKQADEAAQIRLKEGLQAGSQPIKDELKARYNKTNLIDATPEEVEQSIKSVTNRNISTDAAKAMNTFNLGGLDSTEKEKLSGLQQLAKVSSRLRSEFTPSERQKYVGYFTLPLSRISQIVRDDPKFAKFDALVNREGIAAFETGGKALTAQESAIIFGFLPNAKEWSPINFEAKLLEADDYTRSKIGDIVTVATTNRENIGKEMERHLPKKQAKPTAAERYNQLSKQGMKDDDIYRQLTVEGIPVGH